MSTHSPQRTSPQALTDQERAELYEQLAPLIAAVPDFPKPGILFRDITPLLASPEAFKLSIKLLQSQLGELGATHVIGPESRGFIFGVPLAQALGLPFLPARKPGKLPRATASVSYSLEYGQDSLELHADDLPQGARVVLVDDLLATGGTAAACVQLVKERGAEVIACAFLIELEDLNGRALLSETPVVSLLTY